MLITTSKKTVKVTQPASCGIVDLPYSGPPLNTSILFKLFVLSEILDFQHLQTYLFITAYILYTYYYIHILLVGLDDNGGINYNY